MNNEIEKINGLIANGRHFRNFNVYNIRANKSVEENEEESYSIEGIACVFDSPTVLFEWEGIEYKEVVDRHAFDDADISDVIFNYNHSGRVYARTRNDSLHLEVKEDGLHVSLTFDKDDEGHMQLYRDIKNGLIDKMSYAYTVRSDDGEKYDPETHTYTVLKIKKLYDVSAVDIPAYDATSISARSLIDLDKSIREKLDNEIKAKIDIRRKKLITALSNQIVIEKSKWEV